MCGVRWEFIASCLHTSREWTSLIKINLYLFGPLCVLFCNGFVTLRNSTRAVPRVRRSILLMFKESSSGIGNSRENKLYTVSVSEVINSMCVFNTNTVIGLGEERNVSVLAGILAILRT